MTQTAEEVYNKLPTFQDYLDNMWNADAIEDLVNVFDSMLVEISHNYTDATTEELILNFKDWITFPQANLCFTFFNEAVLNLYNKTRDEEGKEGNMCLVNLRKADNLDTITKYIAKKEGLDNFYIKMVYREKELYRRYLLDILSDTPRNNIEKLDEKLVAEEFLAERGYCKFIYEYDEDFRKTGGKGDAGKANFLHTKFSWATTLIGIVGMAIVVGLIYLLWPVIDFIVNVIVIGLLRFIAIPFL